jgi:hypothetical protein
MLKEMKFQTAINRSNRNEVKSVDKKENRNVDVNLKKNSDKLNKEKTEEGSLESTFHKSIKGIAFDKERDDVIMENLKYFVGDTSSIKKLDPKKNIYAEALYLSKEYLNKSNNKFLINSIFNETSFIRQKKELNKSRSQTNTKFYNFDKSLCLDDNSKNKF